jgi:hypothetical protein
MDRDGGAAQEVARVIRERPAFAQAMDGGLHGLAVGHILSASFAPRDAATVYRQLVEDPDFPVGAVFDWRT